MECKKIQDWLITDHLDGELTSEENLEVRRHLEGCGACREFLTAVDETARAPFKGLGSLSPDPGVWQEIQNRIAMEEASSRGWLRKLRGLLYPVRRPFPVLRVAFALAVLMLVVLVSKWPFNSVEPAYAYVAEQMTFMDQLQSGDPDLLNGDADSYEGVFEEITQ